MTLIHTCLSLSLQVSSKDLKVYSFVSSVYYITFVLNICKLGFPPAKTLIFQNWERKCLLTKFNASENLATLLFFDQFYGRRIEQTFQPHLKN